MKRIMTITAAIILTVSLPQAQTVSLSGKITNTSGAPVAGAEVKLVQKKMSTRSGADGCYKLPPSVPVAGESDYKPTANASTIKNSILTVAGSAHDRLIVDVFDNRGRLLWKAVRPAVRATHTVHLPFARLSPQSGIVRVTTGAKRRLFVFALTGAGASFSAQRELEITAGTPVAAAGALVMGTLPILDTLEARGTGFSTNAKIRLYVYSFTDTMDFSLGEPDSNSEARQQCVHRINAYRATLHLAHLVRNTAMEKCVDEQCSSDAETGVAHGAFGKCQESAQNECPKWSGPNPAAIRNSIVINCLQMMWDEGPGEPYSAHGHYINMSNPAYTKVACGFHYSTAKKAMWGIQDFWTK